MRQEQPDLILLDLIMPGMDGFEFVQRLHDIQQIHTPVIIALSASAFQEIRQRSLDAGCHDFLTKPFQLEKLLELLSYYLSLEWIYEESQSPQTDKKSGEEALSALRGHPGTKTIPFIFLTAKSGREDVRKGMRLGADDYLTKPFTVSELLAAIQERLERHKTIHQHAENVQLKPGRDSAERNPYGLERVLKFAHLLKTPEKLQGLEEVSEIGKVLVENGQQLERAVENSLIYAELKFLQQYSPDIDNVWLSGEFIAFFARYTAKQYHQEHDLSLQLAKATISLSSKSFQKILIELLDNAFKFSEPGQGVRVIPTSNHQEFVLQVFDEGLGMTWESIRYIERLPSLERFPKKPPYGSGKGLIISQLPAARWGATLRLASKEGIRTKATAVFNIAPEEDDNVTRNRVSR